MRVLLNNLPSTCSHEGYNSDTSSGCGNALKNSFTNAASSNTGARSNSAHPSAHGPKVSNCNKNNTFKYY